MKVGRALGAVIALGAVAVVTLVLVRAQRAAPSPWPSIEVRQRAGGSGNGDRTVVLRGDRVDLRVTASQLWLFLGDELIAECPGRGCRRFLGGFAMTWTADQLGRHRALAASGPTIPAAGGFDEVVLAARARHARLSMAVIDVIEP